MFGTLQRCKEVVIKKATVTFSKNRDGESNKRRGLMFLGECGYFSELLSPTEMTSRHYDYVTGLREVFNLRKTATTTA